MRYGRQVENFGLVLSVLGMLVGGSMMWGDRALAGDPVPVDGNPTCEGLGYANGFKPEPQSTPWGTHTIPGTTYTVTISQNQAGNIDWSSTLGMDAVIVKGGPNANLYIYQPPSESFGDTDLHPQTNPQNNKYYGLSHLVFCYDFELAVSKTANTAFTRTHSWTIDKQVDDNEHRLFAGQSAESNYSVDLTKQTIDSDWAVSGAITITNPDPSHSATITGVTDALSLTGPVSVICPVSMPYNLAAGGTLVCNYATAVAGPDAQTNVATATTTGSVGGGSGSAAVTFGDPTTVNGPDAVTLTDSLFEETVFGPYSNSTTVPYSFDFPCSTDIGDYTNGTYSYQTPNTATIVETEQTDQESVTTSCYAPLISKNAETTFARAWNWAIDKTGDQTAVELEIGATTTVNYQVVASTTGSVDSDWAVSGTVTLNNPHPDDEMTIGLTDMITGGLVVETTCGAEVVVPAAGSVDCDYTRTLPNGNNRVNTAVASLNGLETSATADVVFGEPTTLTDECVNISDSMAGVLGTLCQDASPQTFSYSHAVGPYQVCGEYTVPNTATLVTNDSSTTLTDQWSVAVNIACDETCTLTIGYWKTHSQFGPAQADPTWNLVTPSGATSPFFLSGKTWYQVAWTSPNGNAYYILAHQFIAATLNKLDGTTSTPAVDNALAWSDTFFTGRNPATKLTKIEKQDATNAASLLDQYNNGLIGPGHCE